MSWDKAMEVLLALLHSGKLTEHEEKAVDKVIDYADQIRRLK